MKYWEDAILGRMFNKVGDEFSIPPSEVKELFEAMFIYTKEALGHPEMPKVRVPSFGTFTPSAGKISGLLKYIDGNPEFVARDPIKIEELRVVCDRVKKEVGERKRKKPTSEIINKKEKE